MIPEDAPEAGAPLLWGKAEMGLLSLKRRLWADLVVAFQYLKGAHEEGRATFYTGR